MIHLDMQGQSKGFEGRLEEDFCQSHHDPLRHAGAKQGLRRTSRGGLLPESDEPKIPVIFRNQDVCIEY